MKIDSKNGTGFLVIDKLYDSSNDYSFFDVKVEIDLAHGKFSAENHDVQFINLPEFVHDLRRFDGNETILPRLEGTYGSHIVLKKQEQDFLIEFRLGDAFCYKTTHQFSFSGSFEIDGDQLRKLFQEFKIISD